MTTPEVVVDTQTKQFGYFYFVDVSLVNAKLRRRLRLYFTVYEGHVKLKYPRPEHCHLLLGLWGSVQ